MTSDISIIVEGALSQARNCISHQQAFEIGSSFGSHVAKQETDFIRRKELRNGLQKALKNADSAHTRHFIETALSIILDIWFDQLLKTSVPASALMQWRMEAIKSRLDALHCPSERSDAEP